jgi:hypothetical protein
MRRYSRSGVAPLWFYAGMAIAFGGLAVWAAVERDWLALALALVMAPIALAGSQIMRRVSASIRNASMRDATIEDERSTP